VTDKELEEQVKAEVRQINRECLRATNMFGLVALIGLVIASLCSGCSEPVPSGHVPGMGMNESIRVINIDGHRFILYRDYRGSAVLVRHPDDK